MTTFQTPKQYMEQEKHCKNHRKRWTHSRCVEENWWKHTRGKTSGGTFKYRQSLQRCGVAWYRWVCFVLLLLWTSPNWHDPSLEIQAVSVAHARLPLEAEWKHLEEKDAADAFSPKYLIDAVIDHRQRKPDLFWCFFMLFPWDFVDLEVWGYRLALGKGLFHDFPS